PRTRSDGRRSPGSRPWARRWPAGGLRPTAPPGARHPCAGVGRSRLGSARSPEADVRECLGAERDRRRISTRPVLASRDGGNVHRWVSLSGSIIPSSRERRLADMSGVSGNRKDSFFHYQYLSEGKRASIWRTSAKTERWLDHASTGTRSDPGLGR